MALRLVVADECSVNCSMSKVGIKERTIIVATDVDAQRELAERVEAFAGPPTLRMRTLGVMRQHGTHRTRRAHGLHSILGRAYISLAK